MGISWDKWNKLASSSQPEAAPAPNLSPISLALKVQKMRALPGTYCLLCLLSLVVWGKPQSLA